MHFPSLFSRSKKQSEDTSDSLYSNPTASSSAFRLPPLRLSSQDTLLSPPPRPSLTTSNSDIETRRPPRSRHPPPSKSAFFAAYVEHTGAVLSTHSLPHDSDSSRYSSFSSPGPHPTIPAAAITTTATTKSTPAKPSSALRFIFPWSKTVPKAKEKGKINASPPPLATTTDSTDSFNLKSFRHIRAPSPPPILSPVVSPHLGSEGNASDTSQRISVAAFREAYARRSTAESSRASSIEHDPSPRASRSPPQTIPRSASSTSFPSRSSPNLRGPMTAPNRPHHKTTTAPVDTFNHTSIRSDRRPAASFDSTDPDTTDDESPTVEEEDDDDDDDDDDNNNNPPHRRQVMPGKPSSSPTNSKPKAKSEIGHSNAPFIRSPLARPGPRSERMPVYSPRVLSAYDPDPDKNAARLSIPRSQSSLGTYGAGRMQYASASTGSLSVTPRSSFVADNPSASSRRITSRSSTPTSTDTSSSDDEDAPLASLVSPRDTASTGTAKHRKPLVDISGLSIPNLSPSKGISSTDTARFRPAINVPRTDKSKGPEKRSTREAKSKGKGKAIDSAILSSGDDASDRPAKPNSDTRISMTPPVPGRHHRSWSSDGHVIKDKDTARDSGASWISGAGWVLVDEEETVTKKQEDKRIVPTPIRQREPLSSFSVTSRPYHQSSGGADGPSASPPGSASLTKPILPRQRSTTLAAPPVRSPLRSSVVPSSTGPATGAMAVQQQPKQRSSSLIPASPAPVKPFAGRQRESPASSTGDSSSGQAPLTPRDGSEPGGVGSVPAATAKREQEWGTGVSGLDTSKAGKVRGHHAKRHSLNFEDDDGGGRERESRNVEREGRDEETRRRERRRSEAKAAIELGNVINGPGPILDDDEGMGSRMSMMNPMMNMGMGPMGMPGSFVGPGMSPMWGPQAWAQQQQQQQGRAMQVPMMSPTPFMMPPPPDPTMLAAHQQAMMYAKQAYQMAVAQQAMVAAGEEWERGSAIGGFGGPGSVYGGGAANTTAFPTLGGWSAQQAMRMFSGLSGAHSDYGGASSTVGDVGFGGWGSSKSVYGESFGPSGRGRGLKSMVYDGRESGHFADGEMNGGAGPPNPVVGKGSRLRATSGPTRSRKSHVPPSSWRANAGIV